MRVGLLGGTGPAGRGLAARLASVGVTAVVGSRDAARAAEVAEGIRSLWPGRDLAVTGVSNAVAAREELIVVATAWDAAVATATEHAAALEGKVVISMANALVKVGQEFHALIPARGSMAAAVQALLPKSKVAAAFQHLPARELGDLDAPLDSDVLVCSDSVEAADVTAALIGQIPGLTARHAGGLASAGAVEAMTAVLLTMNLRYKTHTALRVTGIPD